MCTHVHAHVSVLVSACVCRCSPWSEERVGSSSTGIIGDHKPLDVEAFHQAPKDKQALLVQRHLDSPWDAFVQMQIYAPGGTFYKITQPWPEQSIPVFSLWYLNATLKFLVWIFRDYKIIEF